MEEKILKSRSYRDLIVWQEAIQLVKEIYQMTANFPEKETFGLTSQIRRASVSIPSNVAEGQGRHSSKEFRQFLGIALGSIAELETQIIISREIHYIKEEELNLILIKTDGIRKMLRSLINSLK